MRQLLILLLLLYHAWQLQAQNTVPILDRKVTIKISDQRVGKVLDIISETAGFSFSYGNNIPVNRVVNIQADNKTIREVLDQLFNNEVSYQQIGNHLVLQKKPVPKKTVPPKNDNHLPTKYNFLITGYIRDLYSGDGITNVSIYEKNSLANTLSGDFGYYQLILDAKEPEISVHYTLNNYGDTTVRIKFENNGLINQNINLRNPNYKTPETETGEPAEVNDTVSISPTDTMAVKDTLSGKKPKSTIVWQDAKINIRETTIGKWLINNYQRIAENNIRDSFYRDWQFTLAPPIGTNRSLSGMVTNHFSANLLLGYNGGVNGVEIGVLMNILNYDMRGAQFACVGNLVGGRTYGAQFAGVFNHDLGRLYGFQAAGVYNFNSGNTYGMQAAGVMNINRSLVKGVQAASTINIAKEIRGGQISGLINVAQKVHGFQLGIINVADTNYGITLGLINFVKTGIHQLEISRNENIQYGLAYRSGTEHLYSILFGTTRLPYFDSNTLVSGGWGLGTSIRIFKPLKLTVEATAQQLTFDFNTSYLNMQSKLSVNLEFRVFKGFALFGGASLNYLIADPNDPHFESTFAHLGTEPLFHYLDEYDHHGWVGYQFGIRLF